MESYRFNLSDGSQCTWDAARPSAQILHLTRRGASSSVVSHDKGLGLNSRAMCIECVPTFMGSAESLSRAAETALTHDRDHHPRPLAY